MKTLPEKTQTVYAGLDIAKATLQLHLQGRQHAPPNTAQGHTQLRQWLRAVPGVHVVCEATGGRAPRRRDPGQRRQPGARPALRPGAGPPRQERSH